MYFRNKKKSMHDVYLSDSIDVDKDGNSITLNDVIPDDVNILDCIDLRIKSDQLYRFLRESLTPREQKILIMRYGLYGTRPLTQREVAKELDISRSYVSGIAYGKMQRTRTRRYTCPGSGWLDMCKIRNNHKSDTGEIINRTRNDFC